MSADLSRDDRALILGDSSGFGLATAQKLAERGVSICVVHRDRRGAMSRIEPEFEKIRSTGTTFLSFNTDALAAAKRDEVLGELSSAAVAATQVALESISGAIR